MDLKSVEELMELMRKQGFNHVKFESKDQKIEVTMQPATVAGGMSGMSVMGNPMMGNPMMGNPMMGNPMMATGGMQMANPVAAGANSDAAPGPAKAISSGHILKSPFVGTFYRSTTPGSDPFVEVGTRVRKGQSLCIVEAMKLMNEIESDRDGVIREILVDNGQPVEFDQSLFVIE
jgi:acetyl-CoA carboxylase biotin carboxyl carrier protein